MPKMAGGLSRVIGSADTCRAGLAAPVAARCGVIAQLRIDIRAFALPCLARPQAQPGPLPMYRQTRHAAVWGLRDYGRCAFGRGRALLAWSLLPLRAVRRIIVRRTVERAVG